MTTKAVFRQRHFEGAARMTTCVHHSALQPMNEREMGVIQSLIAWVAAEQDTAPDTVRAITETRFATQHVTVYARKDYDDVIRFLIDLRIDELSD